MLEESDDDDVDQTDEARALEKRAMKLLRELAKEPAQGLIGIAIKAFALAYSAPAAATFGPAAWLTEALMLDIRRGVPGMKRLITPDGLALVLPPKPVPSPAASGTEGSA